MTSQTPEANILDKKHPRSQYDIYLQDVIENYDEYQKKLYQIVKDIPTFQLFCDVISQWVHCAYNGKNYHIKFQKKTSLKAFKEIISPSFDYFINTIPKEIYKENKEYLKLERFISLLELMPIINGFIFNAPSESPLVFQINKVLLNTYDSNLLTQSKSSSDFTTEDIEAIQEVEFHIKNLIGYDKILDHHGKTTPLLNSDIFLDWLAHQVQHPSKLLRYTPVIYGIQADEKKFLIQLLKAIVCDEYVGVVTPNELKSNSNGYASERLVNIIEELHIEGKNDTLAVSKLRNYISEDEFTILKRCVEPYSIDNKTNYLLLTNYVKSIFLEYPKRRFWVIASPTTWKDPNNSSIKEYYTKLFEALEHKEALKGYFLERKISEEFESYNNAPVSESFHKLQTLTNKSRKKKKK